MRRLFSTVLIDRRGASAVEYALIGGLIALAAIVGMTNLRERIIILYGNVTSNVQRVM